MRAATAIKAEKRSKTSSYMDEVSPHRHMRSYDDVWVHEPLSRISHLSVDSITFALNLRSEKKKTIEEQKKDFKSVEIESFFRNKEKTGKLSMGHPCYKPQCVHEQEQITLMNKKNKKLKQLINELEIVRKDQDAENDALEKKIIYLQQIYSDYVNKLYEDKITEQKKNLPQKLKEVQIEFNILLDELDIRQKKVLRLNREHVKSALPRGHLCPDSAATTREPDNLTFQNDSYGSSKSPIDNSRFFHTGVYRRTERTGWEACWTCCLSAQRDVKGCQEKPILSPKPKAIVRGKSMSTVDLWAQSRAEAAGEARGMLPQWSSPSLRASPSLKAFKHNRLTTTPSKLTLARPVYD